jgi:hypothetical protein
LTTPPHTHACSLCVLDFACELDCDAMPERSELARRRCPACDAGLEALDGLPRVRPPRLSGVSLALTVRRAARRACESTREGVDALSVFCADVDVLGPSARDSLESADAWYRMGAMQGARDAWLGRTPKPPPDLPSDPDVAFCYNVGWASAYYIVGTVKMEMMNNG